MISNEIELGNAPIEIIDGDRGSNYPKQNEYLDEGYCLFLNAKNVTDDGFRFEENQFISEDKDLSLRKGKAKRNDIILTTRGTLGNVAWYAESIEFENIRINSGMVLLRVKASEITAEFLYAFVLKCIFFIDLLEMTVLIPEFLILLWLFNKLSPSFLTFMPFKPPSCFFARTFYC